MLKFKYVSKVERFWLHTTNLFAFCLILGDHIAGILEPPCDA